MSFLPYLLIAILGLLLYLPTIFFGLTYFDDNIWVSGPSRIPQNLPQFFNLFITTDISGIYFRPIITCSFLIDQITSQFVSHSSRLMNIFLHLMNACLLFFLFKKLQLKKVFALCAVLIFVVHPALVQAVAWIPGRTETLLCVFVLLNIICLIEFLESNRKVYLGWHIFFLFLALLTKETALILPIMCALYFWLVNKDKRIQQFYILIIAWLLALALWFVLRQAALSRVNVDYSEMMVSFFNNLPALSLYLGKAMLPIDLSVLPIWADSNKYIGMSVAVVLAGILGVSRKVRRRYVVFGISWFIVFLLPAFIYGYVFPEYRGYISIIGILIIIHESFISEILERNSYKNRICLLIIMVAFFIAASQYSNQYKNRIAFWQNAVSHSPHAPTAHVNMAYAYFDRGDLNLAASEFEETLKLNPKAPTIHYNLAVIDYNQGKLKSAEENLKKELMINPQNAEALSFLKSLKRNDIF